MAGERSEGRLHAAPPPSDDALEGGVEGSLLGMAAPRQGGKVRRGSRRV